MITIAIAFISGGIFFVRRDGVVYRRSGIKYYESRADGPIGFWCNLGINALLFPAGVWVIWWGASRISN